MIKKFINWIKRLFKKDTPFWVNNLIMCPSQCYCAFEYEGSNFCIYLRWRWGDPWSATIVPCNSDGSFKYDVDWIPLEVNFYKHDDYKLLQKECEKIIIKECKNAKWTSNLNLIDCL